MALSKYEKLREGVLGQFAVEGSDPFGQQGVPGHLSLDDDGYVRLALFQQATPEDMANRQGSGGGDLPTFIGFTELANVVLPEMAEGSVNFLHAGHSAAVTRLRGSHAWLGAPIEASPSEVESAGCHFLGIDAWHQIRAVHEEWERFPMESRVQLTLSRDSFKASISDEMEVELTVGASYRSASALTFQPVTTVTVSSQQSRSLRDIAAATHRAQDLLNLAYSRSVTAESGFVIAAASAGESGASSSTNWDRVSMHRPPSTRPVVKASDEPLFTLSEIGDAEGFAAWIGLASRQWRATAPLTTRYRYGKALLENDLMSVCTGIEYWAKAQLGCQDGSRNYVQEMLNGLGEAAPAWVGGDDRFAKQLWQHYNALKHSPEQYDVQLMYHLCEAARLLLMTSLLTSLGPPDGLAEKILSRREALHLGEALRDSLDST